MENGGKIKKKNYEGHLQPTQSPIFEQLNTFCSDTNRILPLDVCNLRDIRRNRLTFILHHLLQSEREKKTLTAGTNFPWNSSTTIKLMESSSFSSTVKKQNKNKNMLIQVCCNLCKQWGFKLKVKLDKQAHRFLPISIFSIYSLGATGPLDVSFAFLYSKRESICLVSLS